MLLKNNRKIAGGAERKIDENIFIRRLAGFKKASERKSINFLSPTPQSSTVRHVKCEKREWKSRDTRDTFHVKCMMYTSPTYSDVFHINLEGCERRRTTDVHVAGESLLRVGNYLHLLRKKTNEELKL